MVTYGVVIRVFGSVAKGTVWRVTRTVLVVPGVHTSQSVDGFDVSATIRTRELENKMQ